jgi:hypothetical protein
MTLADQAPALHLAVMTLPLTLAITLALLGLAVFAGWRGSRPPDLIRGVRMIPWRGIMVSASAGVLFMVVHLVNLLGFTTGR